MATGTSTNRRFEEHHIGLAGKLGVGKQCLAVQFALNHFLETYDPTGDYSYRKQLLVDNVPAIVEALDIGSSPPEYPALFEQMVNECHAFVVLYSITDRASFEEVRSVYESLLEVKRARKEKLTLEAKDEQAVKNADARIPFALVGNKSDLYEERVVTKEEGEKLARELDFHSFSETSAKSGMNAEEPFIETVRAIRRIEAKDEEEKRARERDAEKEEEAKRKKSEGCFRGRKCVVM